MDLAVEYSRLGGEAKVIALLKYATNIIGSVGGYGRLPVRPLNEDEKARIRAIFTKMGLIG